MSENETKAQAAAAPCDCFCRGVGPQFTNFVRMRSAKSAEHFRKARVEFLKGLRTIIDERIEKLSQTPPKGTSVPVE
jgi:hypothetical protein